MLRLFCSQKGNLKKHIEAKHSIGKNYNCNMCEKVFKTKQNLKYHIETTHTEISHKCDQCLSTFTHRMCLKEHMKIHTGEKLYPCEVRATKLLSVIFLIIL